MSFGRRIREDPYLRIQSELYTHYEVVNSFLLFVYLILSYDGDDADRGASAEDRGRHSTDHSRESVDLR